jgi:excisionase family DNA binding protein
MYKSIDELPLTITVIDIADILGISRNNAYAVANSEEFPKMRIGKRIIIPKAAFVKWLEETRVVNI